MDLPLPENLDCERFVLGALLSADPGKTPVAAIMQGLAPADFHLEKHRRIFLRMTEIEQRGAPLDRVTLANELDKHGQLQSVDGLSYLVSLDEGLPVLHNLEGYIAILREKSDARSLIANLRELEGRAFNGESAAELTEKLRGLPCAATSEENSGELFDDVMERVGINEIILPQNVGGIIPPTGWLPRYLRFKPGELTILAARTSVGKSAFALQSMYCSALQGQKSCLYSIEMVNVELVRRLIGQVGMVNMHKLGGGFGSESERHLAVNATHKICEVSEKLLFQQKGTVTLPLIRQQLTEQRFNGHPVRFLIVDYLQLLSSLGRFGSRAEEVSSFSRGLKTIAQDFGIPVLALSQLNRKADEGEREPRLSDLRESGSIEHDADNVLFLHRRSEKEDAQETRLIIAKNRGGPCGRHDLVFVKRYTRFEETEQEAA